MPLLPSPLRAALGLVATMVDEARHLPDRAIEVPMLAISRALQLSMRAQQQYAALEARGDEVIAGLRTADDAPAWATFDDDAAAPGSGALGEAVPVDVSDALTGVGGTGVGTDAGSAGAGSSVNGARDDGHGDAAPRRRAATRATTPAPRTAAAPSPRPRARADKTVRAPRNAAPSAFDAVSDDV